MADVIYKKGQSANLNKVTIEDGQILVTEDTAEMFVDMSDGTRKKITDNNKPGVKMDNGGEIFNDYENNQAISTMSTASGYNTLAGSKVFIIDTNNSIGEINSMGKYVLDSVEGLEIGDVYSVFTDGNYENIGIIEDIYYLDEYLVNNYLGEFDSLQPSPEYVNKIVYMNDCYQICYKNPNYGIDDDPDEYIWSYYKQNEKVAPYNYVIVTNYYKPRSGTENHFRILEKPLAGTTIVGTAANAEGYETKAELVGAHAEGCYTIAGGKYSHAEGNGTQAGYAAHSEGYGTEATNHAAHAEGWKTKALGRYSHAEGGYYKDESTGADVYNVASGQSSHVEGEGTKAQGRAAHAEGIKSEAKAYASHTEGLVTSTEGNSSHAEGHGSKTTAEGAHAEGYFTKALSNYSHTEGRETTATEGQAAHAEGYGTTAKGEGAHAEGGSTNANGYYSHAEGEKTNANGRNSHAEGIQTTASGERSHAENSNTKATGLGSHAEGTYSTASGDFSHAEGNTATASGKYSHAGGVWTIAGYEGQTAIGKYNKNKTNTLFEIGNGADRSNRSNAFEVYEDGHAEVQTQGQTSNSIVTKAYVDNQFTTLNSKVNTLQNTMSTTLTREIVDSLPEVYQIEMNKIYMLRKNDDTSNNVFDEYLGIDELALVDTEIDNNLTQNRGQYIINARLNNEELQSISYYFGPLVDLRQGEGFITAIFDNGYDILEIDFNDDLSEETSYIISCYETEHEYGNGKYYTYSIDCDNERIHHWERFSNYNLELIGSSECNLTNYIHKNELSQIKAQIKAEILAELSNS